MNDRPGVFYSPIGGADKTVEAGEKLGIDDVQRADLAIEGARGKRLTYETTCSPRPA